MTCLRSGRYLEAEAAQSCAQSSQELGTKRDTLVLPSKTPWLIPSKGDLQAGSRAVQDSKGRVPSWEGPALAGGGGEHLATFLPCVAGPCSSTTNQISSLPMDLSHSLLAAQGNEPTANPTLVWLFAPKSVCGISRCKLKGLYPRVELGITANTSCFTSPNISSFERP